MAAVEEEKDEIYRSTCFCCSTRTCLLIWLPVSIITCAGAMLLAVLTGLVNLKRKENLTIFITLNIYLLVLALGFIAILLKNRKMLILFFWFGIFMMIYFLVILCITTWFIFGLGDSFNISTMEGKILIETMLAVFNFCFIAMQLLFGQAVHDYARKLKDIEDQRREITRL